MYMPSFFRTCFVAMGAVVASYIGLLAFPSLVSAAACAGSCVPSANACPTAFPIANSANTCPTAGQKCCEKDSLSSGGGSGTAPKQCAQAPGGGICVGANQACPQGKSVIDNSYYCPSLGSVNCCTAGTGSGGGIGSPTKLTDPLGGVGLYGLVRRVINAALGLVGAIALLVFFASGVMYMVGGEEYVTTAKAAMTNAAIGLAVIFFAYSIANFFFMALTTNPI